VVQLVATGRVAYGTKVAASWAFDDTAETVSTETDAVGGIPAHPRSVARRYVLFPPVTYAERSVVFSAARSAGNVLLEKLADKMSTRVPDADPETFSNWICQRCTTGPDAITAPAQLGVIDVSRASAATKAVAKQLAALCHAEYGIPERSREAVSTYGELTDRVGEIVLLIQGARAETRL
jgi:hypothetical protein